MIKIGLPPVCRRTPVRTITHLVVVICAACLAPLMGKTAEVSENSRLIRISTARAALTFFVGDDGRLYELGFGGSNHLPREPEKTPARETEFHPPYGNGFILEPAVQATHSDGNTSTDLIYVKQDTTAVDTNVSLTRIGLKDRFYPFFVTLCLRTFASEDVIEEWTEIRHEENGPVVLYRFASSAPVLKAKEYWLTQLEGDYLHEATLVQEKLTPGIKVLDSKLGVRSSKFRTPSFILSLDGPANEDSGEAFGGSLEWSGSYQFAFDVDWENRLRVLSGINPFGSQYHLERDKTFVTPGMLWTWSGEGKGQVSRNFHHWARRYGIRDGDKPRPILLNNWEATYFNFDEDKIVSLLDGAKELGVELFLLDDGWFGNKYPRNNDRAGLGDWQVNTNKLPHGLSYLASQANKRGLRFGIWFEPEMVNPKSELYEQHPEWAIGEPHREPELSRNQLDLDLSRPAVREFTWKCINDTLAPNLGITYVKWDANRFVTQPGSTYLKPDEQSHLLIDYNFALYDLMGRMAHKFPNVMGMCCSGGAGRADYGALKYFDSFWTSDDTDPRNRVFIQWGFSHVFPAAAISAHVTRMGKRPLKFALDVAMSGMLGFDVDLAKTSPADRKAMANAVELYKSDLRSIVAEGDLYRLESPYEGPRSALDYVSPDRDRAVLFVYQLKSEKPKAVKLHGLVPQKRYQVREVNLREGTRSQLSGDGQMIDGATLMREGLVPPCRREFESMIIELNAEK